MGLISGAFWVVSVGLGFLEFGQGFKLGDGIKYAQALVLSVWIVVRPSGFGGSIFISTRRHPIRSRNSTSSSTAKINRRRYGWRW